MWWERRSASTAARCAASRCWRRSSPPRRERGGVGGAVGAVTGRRRTLGDLPRGPRRHLGGRRGGGRRLRWRGRGLLHGLGSRRATAALGDLLRDRLLDLRVLLADLPTP